MIIDENAARQRHVRLGHRNWISQLKLCALIFVALMIVDVVSLDTLFWGLSWRSMRRTSLALAAMSLLLVYVFPWIRRKYRWYERREATKPGPFDQPF
jgi:hypothetical protein